MNIVKTFQVLTISSLLFSALPALAVDQYQNNYISVEAYNQVHNVNQRDSKLVAADNKMYKRESNQIQKQLRQNLQDSQKYESIGNLVGIDPWSQVSHEAMTDMVKDAQRNTDIINQRQQFAREQADKQADQRAQIIDEEAQNLQALANEKASDPGVHLNEQFSGLYVQNY